MRSNPFSKPLSKKLYRYGVQWPLALLKKLNIPRYHKRWATWFVVYVVAATLSAIENYSHGSWGMPVILFNIALLAFIIGMSEVILVVDKRYKGKQQKYHALSRAISYCGVAFTIVVMCDLYAAMVRI